MSGSSFAQRWILEREHMESQYGSHLSADRDITVRLKNGRSPLVLREVREFSQKDFRKRQQYPLRISRSFRYDGEITKMFLVSYISSLSWEGGDWFWRPAEDFVTYDEGKEVMTTKMLYQTNEEKPRYGILLTKNSKGQLVLEMKGEGGIVEAFDFNQVTEVVPYTIELEEYGSLRDSNRHYRSIEGELQIGDIVIVLDTGAYHRVKEINTRMKNPTPCKNGLLKIAGTIIPCDEA
jgi:hypothetical protein